jgi:hypothetical protein
MSKSGEAVRLKPFSMSMVGDGAVVIFIGKRKTGKSFCVRDLMFNKSDFPVGSVMSGTEEANQFYADFVPNRLISYEWSPKKFDKFIKRQQIITTQKKTDPNFNFCDPRGFIILDDLMYDTSWIKYKSTKMLFMNGRHYNIMFVITMQYPLGITPALRTNLDYVFIFRETNIQNRKRLYENYAGMFPSFDVFCKTMDKYTSDYGCMVICNDTNSNCIEDQVFSYKAKDHGPFKTCDTMLWEMSEKKTLVANRPGGPQGGAGRDRHRNY